MMSFCFRYWFTKATLSLMPRLSTIPISLFRYSSPCWRSSSGWVCPAIRYSASGCSATTAGIASITYSRPLPCPTRPNVAMIARPSSPSFAFILRRPRGSMCGIPWGITVGVFVTP